MAEWTSDIRWSGVEASWIVEMCRDGEPVFMQDGKGRPFMRAFMRKTRAQRVAFSDLEFAQANDRLPYRRVRQYTADRLWEC